MSIRASAPFFICDVRRTAQLGDQGREVRVVADKDGSEWVAVLSQHGLHGVDAECHGQSIVDLDTCAEVGCDDVGGLGRPELRRGDEDVRRESDADQEQAKTVRLTLALGRQGTSLVGAIPGHRVARVGVAEEIEFGHVLDSVLAGTPAVMD